MRHLEPSSVELNREVHQILETKGPSLEPFEVYGLLLESHEEWVISERRVAKFVKRYKAGNPSVYNGSQSATPSRSLDWAMNDAGPSDEESASQYLPKQYAIPSSEPSVKSQSPSRDESVSVRGFLRRKRKKKKHSSSHSLKSSTSSSKGSQPSVRSSFSMFMRRRRTGNIDSLSEKSVASADPTRRSRFSRVLASRKSRNNNNNDDDTPATTTELRKIGGIQPLRTFEPVDAVPSEESAAIQAAIQAILRKEVSRQKHIDTMEQVKEVGEEDEEEPNAGDRGEENLDEINAALAATAYLDENDLFIDGNGRPPKETCCCWNR